jgi:hypothetical protein
MHVTMGEQTCLSDMMTSGSECITGRGSRDLLRKSIVPIVPGMFFIDAEGLYGLQWSESPSGWDFDKVLQLS